MMKRFLLLVLAFLVLSSSACAESKKEQFEEITDAMTFDEIVSMYDQTSFDELVMFQRWFASYIMSRQEWKSVTVPAGQWIIGQDIPEGYYSVRAANEKNIAIISARADGELTDDFYYVFSDGKSVGKVFFKSGCVFKTNCDVILEPPKGLDF